MRFSWKISRYLVASVLPYFVFSWLLLSVVLFVQQGSRFSDIFFSVNIPSGLVWQLSFALIPNVIAFTCPMAALVGVIIGLTKMQGDSELTAMRAAGIGNLGITLPFIVLGLALAVFAFFVNLAGVPAAAAVVRQVALQTALYKLESPIEPGVFNTEVAGYTIYVKDGDVETGRWKNIFIYNEDDKTQTVRLITSSSGRIDYTNENSELVLENAVASTFTRTDGVEKFYSERIGEVRYAVKTKRGELVQRLNSTELTPEELGLAQLSTYAQAREGKDRVEAEILWYRRIVLSITPLVFCLFGSSLVLRYNRRGRGFAVLSALLTLICYYLLAFLGEQLARTGTLSAFSGSMLPLLFSFFAVLWLNVVGRFEWAGRLADRIRTAAGRIRFDRKAKFSLSDLFVDLTTGLRDFDIIADLVKYYLLSLTFLTAIFVIFTGFELWKFAGTIENGTSLLLRYLFFLTPFIYLQLAPSAAMIATLATYVIKSRQNEIVTWTSAGQSVYRLLLPCMLFMIALGFINWQVQERIAPRANQVQDDLRTRLRSRGALTNRSGKLWVARGSRIFSFDLASNASDNASAAADCSVRCPVQNLVVYEFTADNAKLQSVYRIPDASWERERIVFGSGAEKLDLSEGKIVRSVPAGDELTEASNPFAEVRRKPSHLDSEETKQQVLNSESEVERRSFAVALARKYSTPFLPFIIALFTAPFALSLSRTGKAATTGYAIGLWLVFMGLTSAFEQLGMNGSLDPSLAVWAPLMAFSLLGVFLLSRTKT